MLKVRGPYDVNQLAIIAVNAALAEPDYTKDYVREVMNKSRPLLETWLDEKGVEYWKSSANYIWAFLPRAQEVATFLQEQGILVRPKANQQGELGLRITLGNVEQTKSLISELERFLSA